MNKLPKVRSTLSVSDLARYVVVQLNTHFPDPTPVVLDDIVPIIPSALARLEYCFARVYNKYFFDGTQAVFNHLHGDQYAMWLYFLSNELFRQGGDLAICSKLFLLNKALHACDIFYEVALPDIFLLVHPLGTVLGRGNYSDFLVSYQRVGVGSNRDIFPTLGSHVTLRPGAAVLGDCQVGNMCQIAAESLLLDRHLPDRSCYLGTPKQFEIRPNTSPNMVWRNLY